MKPFLALLLACAFSRAVADVTVPADAALKPNVRIEVQIVAIPEAIAIPLTTELKDKAKIEGACAKVQELLDKGVGKLIGWPIVTTRSGQRAVIEAVKEIRYATEFSPPTVQVQPGVPIDAKVKVAPEVDLTALEGVPATFETRNAGVTFEVEPVLADDGKTIELNLVPQHVRLDGYHKTELESSAPKSSAPKMKASVEQPEFHTNKITTSISIQSGQHMLLGVYPTNDPPKHLEFFILKAEVVPVE
jgi:hypothetical protein